MKRKEEAKVEPTVEIESIFVYPNILGRKVKISIGIETVIKEELNHLLRGYADIFS